MPSRLSAARLRSRLDSESDSTSNVSSIGVFAHVRLGNPSSSMNAPGPSLVLRLLINIASFQVTCLPDGFRALKRRKTSGLNARFDRMLEDINIYSRTSPRRRARSSGSSSISSHDVPKTPVDAYSGLSDGRLGPKFSVIKMKHTLGSPKLTSWEQNKETTESYPSAFDASFSTYPMKSDQLPAWLSSTLSTLDVHHPLRVLLPSPRTKPHHNQDATLMTAEQCYEPMPQSSPITRAEGSVFAFCPSQLTKEELLTNQELTQPEPLLLGPSLMPYGSPSSPVCPTKNVELAQTHAIDNARSVLDSSLCLGGTLVSPDILPFSTAGPCHHSSSLKSPLNADVRYALDLTVVKPVPPSFPSDPFVRPGSPLLRPSFVPVLSGGRSTSDTTPELLYCKSLDDGPFYEDLTTDTDVSDPPPFGFPHSNQIPFSTPGPAYRPIYFDSPTEDPSDSDPLQPGYEVPCDTFDFRWEPFNRKGTSSTLHVPSTPQRQGLEHVGTFLDYQGWNCSTDDYDTTGALVDDIDANIDTEVGELSKSRNLEHVTLDHRHFAHEEVMASFSPLCDDPATVSPGTNAIGIPEHKSPALPVFAPAPGVFISPLRGASSVLSQDGEDIQADKIGEIKTHSAAEPNQQHLSASVNFPTNSVGGAYYRRCDAKAQVTTNRENDPASSQLSNDSIKSWSD